MNDLRSSYQETEAPNGTFQKHILFLYYREKYTYLIDLGGTFDTDNLSISLTTNSLFKKNSVPLDTLTGMRMRSATMAVGRKIFKLPQ